MSYDTTASGERRDGPHDRRLLDRSPASNRRSPEGRIAGADARTGEDYLNPPVSADASAPPTENTQLLFERS